MDRSPSRGAPLRHTASLIPAASASIAGAALETLHRVRERYRRREVSLAGRIIAILHVIGPVRRIVGRAGGEQAGEDEQGSDGSNEGHGISGWLRGYRAAAAS